MNFRIIFGRTNCVLHQQSYGDKRTKTTTHQKTYENQCKHRKSTPLLTSK